MTSWMEGRARADAAPDVSAGGSGALTVTLREPRPRRRRSYAVAIMLGDISTGSAPAAHAAGGSDASSTLSQVGSRVDRPAASARLVPAAPSRNPGSGCQSERAPGRRHARNPPAPLPGLRRLIARPSQNAAAVGCTWMVSSGPIYAPLLTEPQIEVVVQRYLREMARFEKTASAVADRLRRELRLQSTDAVVHRQFLALYGTIDVPAIAAQPIRAERPGAMDSDRTRRAAIGPGFSGCPVSTRSASIDIWRRTRRAQVTAGGTATAPPRVGCRRACPTTAALRSARTLRGRTHPG